MTACYDPVLFTNKITCYNKLHKNSYILTNFKSSTYLPNIFPSYLYFATKSSTWSKIFHVEYPHIF